MRHRTIRAMLGLLVTAGLVVAMAVPAEAAVRIRATGGARFRPRKVEITDGTRVIWRSVSGTHTVTAYRGDWSKDVTISTGETTSFRFRQPGRYRFRCRFHSTLTNGRCSGMCGVVVVS
jgi:plastocyanin